MADDPKAPKDPDASSSVTTGANSEAAKKEEANRKKAEDDAALLKEAAAAQPVSPNKSTATSNETSQVEEPKVAAPPKSMAAKVVAGLKHVLSSEGGIIYINLYGKGSPEEPGPQRPKAMDAASSQVKQPESPKVAAENAIESEAKSTLQQTNALKPDENIPPQYYVGGNDPNKKSEPASLVQAPPEVKLTEPSSTKTILDAAKKVAEAVTKMTETPPKAATESQKSEPVSLVQAPPEVKLTEPSSTKSIMEAASKLSAAVAKMEKSANDGGLGNQVNISAEAKASEPKPVESRQKLADVAKMTPDATNDQTLLEAKRERKEDNSTQPSSPRPGGGGPGRG